MKEIINKTFNLIENNLPKIIPSKYKKNKDIKKIWSYSNQKPLSGLYEHDATTEPYGILEYRGFKDLFKGQFRMFAIRILSTFK